MEPENPPFPHLVHLAGQDASLVCGPDGCTPEAPPVEQSVVADTGDVD